MQPTDTAFGFIISDHAEQSNRSAGRLAGLFRRHTSTRTTHNESKPFLFLLRQCVAVWFYKCYTLKQVHLLKGPPRSQNQWVEGLVGITHNSWRFFRYWTYTTDSRQLSSSDSNWRLHVPICHENPRK